MKTILKILYKCLFKIKAMIVVFKDHIFIANAHEMENQLVVLFIRESKWNKKEKLV